MDKEEIIAFLKENKQLLQERFKIDSIALVGSFARDEATPQSDIDIIVNMPSSFHAFFHLKSFLESHFNREVDLGLEKNLRSFIKKKMKNESIEIITSQRTGNFIGILDNHIGTQNYKELRVDNTTYNKTGILLP